MKKQITDKKKVLRQTDHLTTPPRLEGKAKNAGLDPVRKKKKGQAQLKVLSPSAAEEGDVISSNVKR